MVVSQLNSEHDPACLKIKWPFDNYARYYDRSLVFALFCKIINIYCRMYDTHICVEHYVSKCARRVCIHILCRGDVEGNTNPSYFVCSSSLAHSFEVFRVFLVRRGWSFDEGLVKWYLWNSRVFMFINKYML